MDRDDLGAGDRLLVRIRDDAVEKPGRDALRVRLGQGPARRTEREKDQ
jgi:hypothetical protein